MFGLTAAHKSLPFGTLLRITDLKTGRMVDVKVNERGPFSGRRLLALSYGAAKKLQIIDVKRAEIELKVIGRAPLFQPESRSHEQNTGTYLVQIGSFQSKENAMRLKEIVAKLGEKPFVETYETSALRVYRVRLGPYASEEEALSTVLGLRAKLSNHESISPIVVENY